MNIHTPRISLPKPPSKRLLLIVGCAAVVGLLLTFATIRQVQADRLSKAEATQRAQEQANKETGLLKTIDDLKASNTALQADKTAACSYLKTISTAKQTRSLVTTPTIVHCP